MNTKICHLTTVHPRYDIRIFQKECKSLAKKGYDVNLIVADGQGDEVKDGIKIWDIGKPKDRKERILKFGKKAFEKVIELDCDLVHFHDPEILLYALKFKKHNIKVIFDSHENVADLILTRSYLKIGSFLRQFLSNIYSQFEKYVLKRIDGFVTVNDKILAKYENFDIKKLILWNYPLKEEIFIKQDFDTWSQRKRAAVYIGGVDKQRGILEILEVFKNLDIDLHIAGPISNDQIRTEIEKAQKNENIHYHGILNREEVRQLLSKYKFGLALLHPINNYKESVPIKLFEYLAAGLIVIGSNFSKYKQILEENDIGFTVDPLDIEKMKKTILKAYKIEDKILYQKVLKGQELIVNKYNWESQEHEFFKFYDMILEQD